MRPYLRSRQMSFRYAFAGLRYALQTQPNARIHLFLTVLAVAMGFWLHISIADWASLVIVIGLVWIAELFNTALEAVTDLLSPDFHSSAGTAKDVAAGAVLISSIAALIVGLLVLGPPLMERVRDLLGW